MITDPLHCTPRTTIPIQGISSQSLPEREVLKAHK